MPSRGIRRVHMVQVQLGSWRLLKFVVKEVTHWRRHIQFHRHAEYIYVRLESWSSNLRRAHLWAAPGTALRPTDPGCDSSTLGPSEGGSSTNTDPLIQTPLCCGTMV